MEQSTLRFKHEAIHKLRHSLGESLYKFGARIGLPPQYVQQYESGQSMPRIATLIRLCVAFDLPVGHFFVKERRLRSQRKKAT